MNIGEASRTSGVLANTIRYYEDTGLIPIAGRSRSGYRVYSAKEVHILRFIHRARNLGFAMQEIRRLLALWQDTGRTNAEVKALAVAHLSELDEKLAKIKAMQRTLTYLVAHCEGDDRPDCPILDDLADDESSNPSG